MIFIEKGRRIIFTKTTVRIEKYCTTCRTWGCKAFPRLRPSHTRRKTELRNILAFFTKTEPIFIGCQQFGARTKAVMYARKWVKK